jgi:anti-sigma regulatory factor (Ser/Thr protein kinase)
MPTMGTVMDPEPGFPQASEWSRLMLRSLLAYSGVGVATLSPDMRYTWCNDELTYGGRFPRERRIGLRPTEALPTGLGELMERQLERVLESGVPILNAETFGRSPSDLRMRSWWISIFRIEDESGRVLGAWYTTVDQTEQWRAGLRLKLLNAASERIGSTLDVARTAQELADVAVPGFADIVMVDLLEPVLRGGEPPPGDVGSAVVLRRAGLRSALGASAAIPRTGDATRLPAASTIRRCLVEGTPVVESLTGPRGDPWAAGERAWMAPLRDVGVDTVWAVPVHARDTVLGVASFGLGPGRDAYDEDDVGLAVDLAARAAVCIDNARRYERERHATLALQHNLLPGGLDSTVPLEIATRYLPASMPAGLGGDWVDVIPLSGARVALVVGDVVGHGATAAAAMGQLSTAVRTLAGLDMSPDELLAHLDDRVIKLVEHGAAAAPDATGWERPLADYVLGATCLYAVYDPVTRRCTAARAGHRAPPAIVSDGAVGYISMPAGPPLGLGLLPFEPVEFELNDGALLVLYTDGLIESRDHDIDDGLARLSRDLLLPASSPDEVCDHVMAGAEDTPAQDDIALVVARVHGLDSAHVAAWDVEPDPACVGEARALTGRKLAEWDWEELAFTSELIVSELVTNAIRYGAPPIRLLMIRQEPDTLICEVSDGSSTSPHLRHARTTDEGGRGLFLIAQVAHQWGTRYTASGKTIWAEQRTSGVGPANRAPTVRVR